MKVHIVVSMEMGVTNDVRSFKSKLSARKYLEKYNKDNECLDGNDFVDEVLYGGYFSDHNGYEVFYHVSNLED